MAAERPPRRRRDRSEHLHRQGRHPVRRGGERAARRARRRRCCRSSAASAGGASAVKSSTRSSRRCARRRTPAARCEPQLLYTAAEYEQMRRHAAHRPRRTRRDGPNLRGRAPRGNDRHASRELQEHQETSRRKNTSRRARACAAAAAGCWRCACSTRRSGRNAIFVNAAGCLTLLAVFPFSPFHSSWLYTAMASAPAGAQGVRDALDVLIAKGPAVAESDDLKVVVVTGDGAANGIGLQATLAAIHRGLDFYYFCYDNEAFANTGFQMSPASPFGSRTATTPGRRYRAGTHDAQAGSLRAVACAAPGVRGDGVAGISARPDGQGGARRPRQRAEAVHQPGGMSAGLGRRAGGIRRGRQARRRHRRLAAQGSARRQRSCTPSCRITSVRSKTTCGRRHATATCSSRSGKTTSSRSCRRMSIATGSMSAYKQRERRASFDSSASRNYARGGVRPSVGACEENR